MEPSCHGVLRSLARFRALVCVGAMFVLFPSSVVSSISVCASGHLIRHVHGSRHSARFISHLVVRTHPDVSFHQYSEYGSGAFVVFSTSLLFGAVLLCFLLFGVVLLSSSLLLCGAAFPLIPGEVVPFLFFFNVMKLILMRVTKSC